MVGIRYGRGVTVLRTIVLMTDSSWLFVSSGRCQYVVARRDLSGENVSCSAFCHQPGRKGRRERDVSRRDGFLALLLRLSGGLPVSSLYGLLHQCQRSVELQD